MNLYQSINEEILRERKVKVNKYFIKVSNILTQIKATLQKFVLAEYQEEDEEAKPLTLWELYRKDEMTETEIDNILSSKALLDLTICPNYL